LCHIVAAREVFRAYVLDQGYVPTGRRLYTTSGFEVRFGIALARLARSSELLSCYGPATGAWAYNG
jgi:hypothetical protein